jgi:hypothetical protein
MPPAYKLYPQNYVYNGATRRHVLKGSATHKKLLKDNIPLVETASVLPAKPPPIIPDALKPEIPEVKAQIGTPLPVAQAQPILTSAEATEKAQNEVMRKNILRILKEEIRVNPKPYEAKNAGDLSQAFRKMLIEKLAPQEMPAVAAKNKYKPPPKHTKFKLTKPQVSGDNELSGSDWDDGTDDADNADSTN